MQSEARYFIYGGISIILILILAVMTFIFSDQLLRYSGITTFYSLIAIFLIFAITEYLKKKQSNQENIILLRSLIRVSRQIESDLNYYLSSLSAGVIPPTTMGSFDFSGLPLEINRYSTKTLDQLIILANSKIETINEWKEGYLDILLEPTQKIRDKQLQRFNEVWGNNAQNAINDLRNALDQIRNEIARWIKFES